jgi:hypothetical protein
MGSSMSVQKLDQNRNILRKAWRYCLLLQVGEGGADNDDISGIVKLFSKIFLPIDEQNY